MPVEVIVVVEVVDVSTRKFIDRSRQPAVDELENKIKTQSRLRHALSQSAVSLPDDEKTRDRTISTYLLISHATTSPQAKLPRPSAVIITKLNFTKM